jgi:tRNA A22 N-methylase
LAVLKKRLVSELDKYEELLSEKMRMEEKVDKAQKEASGKASYGAHELAVINSSLLLKKYEENANKFKNVLDEVYKIEAQLNSFWDNADELLDVMSEFDLFKEAVNPNHIEEGQEVDEQLMQEVLRTFHYLTASDLSKFQ